MLRLAWVWVAVISSGLVLGGCDKILQAQTLAGEYGAHAVTTECSLSTGVRQGNVESLNAALAELGSPARVKALDCDGDGASDF